MTGGTGCPPDHTPVVVSCHMCAGANEGHIVTTGSRAWTAAMDHALDRHRAELIADPEGAQNAFTVNAAGRDEPLHP